VGPNIFTSASEVFKAHTHLFRRVAVSESIREIHDILVSRTL
jgi:hypothetical protein